MPLAGFAQIQQHGLVVLVEDFGARRHAQHDAFTVGAGAVGARAMPPALRLEMLLVAVIDQRVEIGNAFNPPVAAASAIAAVRAAVFDEFLAPEARRAGAAVAALEENLGLIEEFHRRMPWPRPETRKRGNAAIPPTRVTPWSRALGG